MGSRIQAEKEVTGNLKKTLDNEVRVVIVPLHDEIAPKTLNSILKQAKIRREKFLELLKYGFVEIIFAVFTCPKIIFVFLQFNDLSMLDPLV